MRVSNRTGRIAGAVAIVTGGGQGIGEAICRTFAREGARVAVVDIARDEGEGVTKALKAAGADALSLQVDVTKTAAVNDMVAAVVAQWGTVDILVNAAGGFHQFAPITEITDEEWDQVILLNLKSCFLCSRAVAPVMMDRKRGRIINIASGSGIAPNPFAPTYLPYGAAKAGVINMTKILGQDLGPYGITVNAISPGTTATPRVMKVRDEASRRRIAEQNALRVLVEPEDSAEAALFFASAEARFITGVNLNVNAGNLM